MNLIIPKFEIWEQGVSSPVEDMWKHIARCTRVCYQSEKKDDKETEEEFVKRVILRNKPWKSDANHLAMLEHGTVYLKDEFIGNSTDNEKSELFKYKNNKYSKCCSYYFPTSCKVGIYITTNLRVIIENEFFEDLYYICKPTEFHYRRVTVSFTTNIGVSREFNRHRVNSISEESTRYCNYNKRNNGQLKIVLPAWITEDIIEKYATIKNSNDIDYIIDNYNNSVKAFDIYQDCLAHCQRAYNELINLGWKPQQAREVLPLATKTQLIHTAFVDDWKHFFALRADGVSGPPHPNAELLAKPLKEEFIKRKLI